MPIWYVLLIISFFIFWCLFLSVLPLCGACIIPSPYILPLSKTLRSRHSEANLYRWSSSGKSWEAQCHWYEDNWCKQLLLQFYFFHHLISFNFLEHRLSYFTRFRWVDDKEAPPLYINKYPVHWLATERPLFLDVKKSPSCFWKECWSSHWHLDWTGAR